MLEENVVAATGVGFRLQRQEIEILIRQAGYEPQVRDHRYKLKEGPAEVFREAPAPSAQTQVN
jgi:hypothetical protein